jgi:hypothetical protein
VLNPHFHALLLDGVFTEDDSGELTFHPLPALSNLDVAEIIQIAIARILRVLRRKGVLAEDERAEGFADGGLFADAQLSDEQRTLASLASASVQGTAPAGPTLRQRQPIAACR